MTKGLFKNMSKLMVRDDDMLINLGNLIDVIEHTAKNRILTNLQQRLREVLCQLPQPCGIPRCNYNIFHFF